MIRNLNTAKHIQDSASKTNIPCTNPMIARATKPTPAPTPLEDLQRATLEQAQLEKLCNMSDMLESIDSYTVDEHSLGSMDVVLGEPLDVDGLGGQYVAPSFFLPWVDEELMLEIDDYRDCRAAWIDKYVGQYKPAEWQIPEEKAQWFVDCLFCLCELDPGIWDPWELDPFEMRQAKGLTLPMHAFKNKSGAVVREYQSKWVYFPVDKSKPHVACMVFDSNDAPGQVLRSEVDYAVELVKFRLQRGKHTNHHTKPALIYTIERDSFARITQAHFDAKTDKLVLRQSRQLDLRGPEPTDDAFVLLRWMANRPVGETEYVDEEDAELGEPQEGDGTTDLDGAAPRLLVGCA